MATRIPVARPNITAREKELVNECLDSSWISSSGKYVVQFEEMFSAFCGVGYGVATSNGTTALHLAMLCLGLGPGDEVLVPSLTFAATANAVKYTGATPVFIDSERTTWNLDPALMEPSLTAQTKAVVPVHLYGHPADMEAVDRIAREYGLAVVEDAAEAHGARVRRADGNWARVGSLGLMGCFSFYGNKIITTGEGGMLVTDDQGLAAEARRLRDHGMSPTRRYWHEVVGYNYRMTNIQAALGVAQMERVDQILTDKKAVAEQYQRELAGVPGLVLPPQADWAENVYWMFCVLVEDAFPLNRDGLVDFLDERGVDTRVFFRPAHVMPPYADGLSLPVCEDLSARGLSLPSGPQISQEEISYVCRMVREAAGI